MKGAYDDIIDLPHHESKVHPRMPRIERAAQFSPFAALSGYEDAIRETERKTEERRHLDDEALTELDRLLHHLLMKGGSAEITYFVADSRKKGGRYATISGKAVGLRMATGDLLLDSGTSIPIKDIIDIRLNEDSE